MCTRIFIYSLFLLISNIGLGHASDRFEDVKAAYDRAMARCAMSDDKMDVEIPEQISSNLPAKTKEQYLKEQEKCNAKLFHALSASISSLSQYLGKAQNDESLEWTYKNGSLSLEHDRERLPLDGVMYDFDQSTGALQVIAVRQLYEIERQKTCFDLTMIWNLFVFWKKSMFPNNTISSYNLINTEALSSQINDLYTKRKTALEAMPIYDELKQSENFNFMIVEMLAQIHHSMPPQFEISMQLSTKTKQRDIQKRVRKIEAKVSAQGEQFFSAYKNFLRNTVFINRCLGELQKSPIATMQNPHLGPNLQTLYRDFLKFTFPGTRGRIRFSSSPLDFARLMPGLISETVDLRPFLRDASDTKMLDATEDQQNPQAVVDEEPMEEVIYDAAYWAEQNRYHAERKKDAGSTAKAQLTFYEFELYTYLEEKIYKYERRKARTLVQELSELKFNVIPNNAGKGSLHYVYPAEDNPLFGSNPDYSGAYFNLHLPNKSEIVPSGYFDYAQSGFGNVFGLTLEYIQQKLNPVDQN